MVITIPPFIQALESHLQDALPGIEAQKKMAPSHRNYPASWKKREDAAPAAVLILLFPRKREWYFMLTERSNEVEHHQGQVSLPGGAREEGESLEETALRETREELGMDVSAVEIIGRLTPLFIPVSRFEVHPFVGWMNREPNIAPDPVEVVSVYSVSIHMLLDERNIKQEQRQLGGEKLNVPFFQFGHLKVWGATAVMLSEFREILSKT